MQRKPDLLWILVILFGLGVVTTGYAQSMWSNKTDAPVELAQQQPKPFKRGPLFKAPLTPVASLRYTNTCQ